MRKAPGDSTQPAEAVKFSLLALPKAILPHVARLADSAT